MILKQRLTKLEARLTSADDITRDAALFTAKMAALAERARENQDPNEDIEPFPANYLSELIQGMGASKRT